MTSLKKSAGSWACSRASGAGGAMPSWTEREGAVRVAWVEPKQLLLRSVTGVGRELAADVGNGPVASEAPGPWKSADHGMAAAPGVADQPQAGGSVDADHGLGSDLPTGLDQPTKPGTSDLSLPAARQANQRSRPGLVCGYHVCADGGGVHVFGGGDGLVEPLCAGLAVEQHAGGRLLHRCLAWGPGNGPADSGHFQYRSGLTVHQRGVSECGRGVWNSDQHGWQRPVHGQYLCRAVVAQPQIRRHLLEGIPGRPWPAPRNESLVRALQPGSASPGPGACDPGGSLFFPGVLWGATGTVESSPVVRLDTGAQKMRREQHPKKRTGGGQNCPWASWYLRFNLGERFRSAQTETETKTGQKSPEKANLKTALRGPKIGDNLNLHDHLRRR